MPGHGSVSGFISDNFRLPGPNGAKSGFAPGGGSPEAQGGAPEVDEQGNAIAGPNRKARRLGREGARSRTIGDVSRNHPGYKPPPVRFDPNNPEQTAADILARNQVRSEVFYQPIQQQVIDSLGDTSIVDNAREQAQSGFDQQAGRTERERRRFGITQSAVQKQQGDLSSERAETLGFGAAVNESRIEQKQRNDGLRRELINIGRGVASAAQSGINDAASLQTNRDVNNRNSEAAAKAQRNKTFGSIASVALTAMLFFI